ncbi:hypothetical protein G6F46_008814 [Rhizopus delemar]|nr:hypothetical protein G6F49_010496 [Rhizopus delemar]KAG1612018.1 hypothetical protein G6F46_008814 [Rhizopus delemar]KAG1636029.1 hypothetical protein G6F44_009653 [Rhizopus delemar]
MCRCSIVLNAKISNNITPTAGPSNSRADAPVAFTTASAGDNLPVTSLENVDDWNEDIKMAKIKIKSQIKRKLQEIEALRKKLRILEDI